MMFCRSLPQSLFACQRAHLVTHRVIRNCPSVATTGRIRWYTTTTTTTSNTAPENTNSKTDDNKNNINNNGAKDTAKDDLSDNLNPKSLDLSAFATTTTPTSAAPVYKNKYHFNSLRFIQRLEESGLSRIQAESVLQALSQVLDETLSGFQAGLATKEAQGKMTYQQKVDFAKLKGELQAQERAEQTAIIHEQEHLNTEIEKLKQRLKEEIGKTQSSVRLDLNLEKGRVREESSVHELKIKETDTRIDSELANMKTQIENVKFQVMQWLITVCTGTFALVMAYIRMIS